MHPNPLRFNRRSFLGQTSLGLGAAALWSLTQSEAAADRPQTLPGLPHFTPRAKRVIFLYMSGGPSHLETFDYKPMLARLDRQPMPASFTAGQPIAQLQNQELKCLAPQIRFRRHGQSGQQISDFLPNIARVADDICILRSVHTDQINHDPAHMVMNTGTALPGRPSMGAWVLYGLGSESANLPGFVVLTSQGGRNPQPLAARQWGPGMLPSRFQGIKLNSTGEAVNYLSNPRGITATRQRDVIDAVSQLNTLHAAETADPEITTRIAQYEMAFQMQMSVPELMDISREPAHVKARYGVTAADGSFAYNCLLARRMAERGVRFIQLYHRGWDHHDNLVPYMNTCCRLCDGPTAALLEDLKNRGLLEDTLIIWGGEFGRTPMVQFKGGGGPGRDHHIRGFSMFLAGAGIKPGYTFGNTDDLGYNATENPVHVRDLHATLLHQLGIDHSRMTVRSQGLDVRLTGVEEAHVINGILK